jgi:hypothetical protein
VFSIVTSLPFRLVGKRLLRQQAVPIPDLWIGLYIRLRPVTGWGKVLAPELRGGLVRLANDAPVLFSRSSLLAVGDVIVSSLQTLDSAAKTTILLNNDD